MNHSFKAVTAFIQRSDDLDNIGSTDVTGNNNQSFDALVSSAFQQVGDTDAHYQLAITELSKNPMLTSDPGALIKYQNYLSEYSNYTSLVSTLARKSVSTIETLEKSQ